MKHTATAQKPPRYAATALLLGALIALEIAVVALLPQFPAWQGVAAHIALDLALFGLIFLPALWSWVVKPLLNRQLVESQRLMAIMQAVSGGILTLDMDGRIVSANADALAMFGYAESELIGQDSRILLPTAERDSKYAELRQYVRRTAVHIPGAANILTGAHKDGSEFPMELSISQADSGHGGIYAVFIRDISAHLAVESALGKSNILLERIFSNLETGVAYLDANFDFVWVNESFARLDGSRADQLVGKNHFKLYPSVENQTIFNRVVRTGEPYQAYARPFEHAGRPESEVGFWDWSLYPIKNAEGQVENLLLNLSDVTERTLAERQRHESDARFKAMLDATSETALLVDLEGKILAINDVGAQRFQKSAEQLIGSRVDMLKSPEQAAKCRGQFQEVIRTAQPRTFEDKHGQTIYKTTVYPVPDSNGQVFSLAIYAEDVTEERRHQAIEGLLQDIDQMALSGMAFNALLDIVCQRLVQTFDYGLAWVGEKKADGGIKVLSWQSQDNQYADDFLRIGVRWDESPTGRGPAGMAIRTGKPQVVGTDSFAFQPWRAAAQKNGLGAVISLPIVLRGQIYGVTTLYAMDPHAFDPPASVRMLEGIINRISVALEMAQEQYEVRLLGTALSTASNAVLICDRSGLIEWVNEAFTKLCGYSSEELLGRTPRMLKSGKQGSDYYQALWQNILSGKAWSSETIERHKEGHEYTVRQTITPILDSTGEVSHFIAIHEDITSQKETAARIHHMAHYDALTQLPNRNLFYDRLEQTMRETKRNKQQMALLFLDLDRFKQVNDTLGHAIGDLLLQQVAKRLRKCVRDSDTVARLAGDEFTVILANIQDPNDAALVSDKIIRAIGKPFMLEGHEVQIGTSIGIAFYPRDAQSLDELVNMADSAMYVAKTENRNTYRFHMPNPTDSAAS